MDNDVYMNEVMFAMKAKHCDVIASTSFDMMEEDEAIGSKMMGNRIDICIADTGMCKMMMGKTIDMCDMDKSKCKMMMGSMKDHPESMQTMKEMGMCNMESMETVKMKKENELTGMCCDCCVSNVKRVLLQILDVTGAEVLLNPQGATITMNKSISVEELQSQLKKAGHYSIN